MSQHTQDPDAIERDLHATRARLDSRLSELARRLSPGQILDEGLDLMRTRQGIDFSRNLGEAVRERPIPVALMGVGLAWLMAGPRGYSDAPHGPARPRVRAVADDDLMTRAWSAGHSVVRETNETDTDYRGRVTAARGKALGVARNAQETAEAYADRVQDALFAARDRVGDAVAATSEKMSAIGSAVGDAMQGVSDRVRDSAHDLRDQGRYLSDAASRGLRQVRDTANGAGGMMATIGENPVLLGALGLAAGALLGALLPPTEIEREYLGEAAHDARKAIEGVVHDVSERGSDVAQAAMEAGRQTVQDIGKNTSDLGGAAADAARDVAGQAQRHAGEMGEATRDAARHVAATATDGQGSGRAATDGARPRV